MGLTIVVVGATGRQGGGVVKALLDSPLQWTVRALTRDPDSDTAKKFLSHNQTADIRLSLVQGHVYDKASLIVAYAGAHGVFGLTSEGYPGRTLTTEEELLHEIEGGRNQVEASKECGVKHFVFSSLPDMRRVTNGKYTGIHHMNNKHDVETIARAELDAPTFLVPGVSLIQLG